MKTLLCTIAVAGAALGWLVPPVNAQSGAQTGAQAAAQSAPDAPESPSRAEAIESAEREKAKHLTPVEPPHGEQKFDHVEQRYINPIFNPNPFGVQVGGLPTGGGFSLGPEYVRRGLLGEHLTIDANAVGSTKKWYQGTTSFDFADLFNGRFETKVDGGYQNAASMPYYGEGPDSSKDGQSDFRREFTTTHAAALGHLFGEKLTAGYSVGGLLVHVGPGDESGWASTTKPYTGANTPGLEKQSNFVDGTSIVDLDLTHPSYDSPSGLDLEASDSQFWDQSGNHASFHLLQTQATYYVPFWNGMRTLVFRARNETTFHAADQQVPFYLQPTLGGPDDLRGYERYRFYDNGSSVLSGEYRWPVSQALELAFFGDGGNVYDRAGLIGLRDLRSDGGFGVRFKNKQQTVMRCDIGFSPEGVKVWFVFNGIFSKLSRTF
jgi:hypothetical protein